MRIVFRSFSMFFLLRALAALGGVNQEVAPQTNPPLSPKLSVRGKAHLAEMKQAISTIQNVLDENRTIAENNSRTIQDRLSKLSKWKTSLLTYRSQLKKMILVQTDGIQKNNEFLEKLKVKQQELNRLPAQEPLHKAEDQISIRTKWSEEQSVRLAEMKSNLSSMNELLRRIKADQLAAERDLEFWKAEAGRIEQHQRELREGPLAKLNHIEREYR